MIRRLRQGFGAQGRAAIFMIVLIAVAILAPALAPYESGEAFRDFLHAPPMAPHVEGGSLKAHPLVLVDRMEQRFEPDRSRSVPLPWFGASDAPVFLFGADDFGRDVLSRLLYGARTSVGLALVATLGAVLIGALAGAWAGYRGGWVDESVMRVADFVLVLPVIYVVLVLRAVLPLVLPPSTVFLLVSCIFILVGWPFVAKGVRAIVAVERQREYVQAAQSLGAGHGRIIIRHLLPACAGHLVVQSTLLLPAFILAEATLSFVGLGFPHPIASWGTMLASAGNYSAIARFPWTLAPAVAIFAIVFATNLITSRHGGNVAD
ncbi:MAG TPA: ABC transporter permease [Vicinamibacterales bacterium]|nr:ABC transporter permease [Vicinamibacterales bacterium]